MSQDSFSTNAKWITKHMQNGCQKAQMQLPWTLISMVYWNAGYRNARLILCPFLKGSQRRMEQTWTDMHKPDFKAGQKGVEWFTIAIDPRLSICCTKTHACKLLGRFSNCLCNKLNTFPTYFFLECLYNVRLFMYNNFGTKNMFYFKYVFDKLRNYTCSDHAC
jgi:hypothetical protein